MRTLTSRTFKVIEAGIVKLNLLHKDPSKERVGTNSYIISKLDISETESRSCVEKKVQKLCLEKGKGVWSNYKVCSQKKKENSKFTAPVEESYTKGLAFPLSGNGF